jgi:hypothetical protein
MAARKDVIEKRVSMLTRKFSDYVSAYDSSAPFSGDQLATHRHTIDLRRQAGSIQAAVANPEFVSSLRRTLIAWGIGSRASILVSREAFNDALEAAAPDLEPFETLQISSGLPTEVSEELFRIIMSLGVVENKAKLVAGTKTLHHLLPDLVMPVDQSWTGRFFQLHAPEWTDPYNQRNTFRRVFGHFTHVAQAVDPEQYVTGEGWRTSQTKVLDNALIGFCKVEMATGNTAPTSAAETDTGFDVQSDESDAGINVKQALSSLISLRDQGVLNESEFDAAIRRLAQHED